MPRLQVSVLPVLAEILQIPAIAGHLAAEITAITVLVAEITAILDLLVVGSLVALHLTEEQVRLTGHSVLNNNFSLLTCLSRLRLRVKLG
jgi:hypothetical protein